MRVYFTGCSGAGKTTLANYVRDTHHIQVVPSAARNVLAEMGYDNHDAIMRERMIYLDYNSRVFQKQVELEKCYKTMYGSFVSDRCVDHMAYMALYGRCSPYRIYDLTALQCYIASLSEKDVLVFHVPPTKECHEAALAQGGRPEFLNWNDMVAFDGMIRYILVTNEIRHFPMTPIALHDRQQLVSGTIDLLEKKQ